MPKFLAVLNSDATAKRLMSEASPEQMAASMQAWESWRQEAIGTIGFEWGLPLEPSARVSPNGVSEPESNASGYFIVEGDREVVARLLSTHPHLERDGATIDLLEMIPMPGM